MSAISLRRSTEAESVFKARRAPSALSFAILFPVSLAVFTASSFISRQFSVICRMFLSVSREIPGLKKSVSIIKLCSPVM